MLAQIVEVLRERSLHGVTEENATHVANSSKHGIKDAMRLAKWWTLRMCAATQRRPPRAFLVELLVLIALQTIDLSIE